MSKQTYITRYLLIIKRLQRSDATFEQITSYLETESEIRGIDYTLAKRTFQRELHEIKNLFGIEIQYSRSKGTYAIMEGFELDGRQSSRLLEAYEMLELVKAAGQHTQEILFEQRKPDGLQHFYGLLHAIKNEKVVNITYQKFDEEEACSRTLYPLALKESRGRWYLIANGPYTDHINPYGLDRITDLEITRQAFQKQNINVSSLFQQAFGIIRSEEPQRVVLSFSPFQGKYIKTYPLHTSQKLIQDDDVACTIELTLYVTHDFIMELLSFGDEVKVHSPKQLAETLKNRHLKAANSYQ